MLQPHQQRVVDEKAALDTKIAALTEFVQSKRFVDLHTHDQMLLYRQRSAMHVYTHILGERIFNFTS